MHVHDDLFFQLWSEAIGKEYPVINFVDDAIMLMHVIKSRTRSFLQFGLWSSHSWETVTKYKGLTFKKNILFGLWSSSVQLLASP